MVRVFFPGSVVVDGFLLGVIVGVESVAVWVDELDGVFDLWLWSQYF